MPLFNVNYGLMSLLYLGLLLIGVTGAVIPKNTVENSAIPECSHLVKAEVQVNSYRLGEGQGWRCCMCPKGTYVGVECKVNDPNSTRCYPCEYDAGKQTYIHYGPHHLYSCTKDTQPCVPPKIKVGGSPSSKARCECPPGHTLVDRFRCEPSHQSSTNDNAEKTTPIRKFETATLAVSSSLKPPNNPSSSFNDIFTTTSLLEPPKNTVGHTTPAVSSSLKPLNNSSPSFNDSFATTSLLETSKKPLGHFLFIEILPWGLAVVILLTIILYFIGEKLGWWRGIVFSCEPVQDVILSSEALAAADEKPDVHDDEIIESTVKASEKSQTRSLAVQFVPNEQEGEDACLIQQQNHQPVQRHRAYSDPPKTKTTSVEHDKKPAEAKGISKLEVHLRDVVFEEWAEIIDVEHLCLVGRKLLQKFKNAFDDIYYHSDHIHGRSEKARKIFLQAVEINPQLQLEEIKEMVKDLGYLRQIVEDNIKKLKTDGDVD